MQVAPPEDAYQQAARGLKQKLHKWEQQFIANAGRQPTKEDILKKPKIAKKYKTYNALKRRLTASQEGPPPNLNYKMETSKSVSSANDAQVSCSTKSKRRKIAEEEGRPCVITTQQQPQPAKHSPLPQKENTPSTTENVLAFARSTPVPMVPCGEDVLPPCFTSTNFFTKSRMKRSSSLLSFSLKALEPAPSPSPATAMRIDQEETTRMDQVSPPRNKAKRKRKASVEKGFVPEEDSQQPAQPPAKPKRRKVAESASPAANKKKKPSQNEGWGVGALAPRPKEDSYNSNGNFVRIRLRGHRGKGFGGGRRGPAATGRYKFLGGRNSKRAPRGGAGYKNAKGIAGEDTPFAEPDEAPSRKPLALFSPDFEATESTTADAPPQLAVSEVNPRVWEPKVYTSKQLHATLKEHFGFSSFRDGQEQAISRILQGQSTLLIIPTGAGKSLCYQMAALLQPKTLVLVICPLVSLMQDQLQNLPSCVSGAAINSQMSQEEQASVIESIRAGKTQILFISPEKLATSNFAKLCATFPPISFACIDEAHCVSEWSHNFRTSYLRLNHLLRRRLGVKCILGLTATATRRAQVAVMDILQISPDGVIRSSSVIRENICCTVSMDSDRRRALIELLKSDRFSKSLPIIIYCTFQREADDIAAFLQDKLFNAASYHAGKMSHERQRLQAKFSQNKIDIIVATVAFGMGINKKDIKGVIHYNLPKSLENYVQEVGRCGRDGQQSQCHLFLSEEDRMRLHSFAFSDSIDESPVFGFCKKLFNKKLYTGKDWATQDNEEEEEEEEEESEEKRKEKEEKGKENGDESYLVGVNMSAIELEFDMRKEVIETILSYLEMDGHLQVLPCSNTTARIHFYKSDPLKLAGQSRLVDAIVKRARYDKNNGYYEADCIALLNHEFKGATLYDLQREFDRLKMAGEITLESVNESFVARILRKPENVLDASTRCYEKTRYLEQSKVDKLRAINSVMQSVAFPTYTQASAITVQTKDCELTRLVAEYFNDEDADEVGDKPQTASASTSKPDMLRNDIRVFLARNSNANLTARQVARIMHGMPSPQLSRDDWMSNPFWKRYQNVEFNKVKEVAALEMQTLRERKADGV